MNGIVDMEIFLIRGENREITLQLIIVFAII